ncbi:MAG: hypothetical protein HY723_05715 [Chloroflexi bacterium]|nr:hypothetical protein [Chloroflexota bacterium]
MSTMPAATTPAAPAPDAPPGYWQREASHYPKPLTPLASSIVLDSINEAFVKVFAEFGLPLERFEFREIGGYVYQAAKPFAVGGAGGTKLPPKPVLWLFFRLHPALRARYAKSKQALDGRRDRALLDRWGREWRPRLIRDIERWRTTETAGLDDRAFAAHLDDLQRWAFEAMDIHFYLTPPYTLAIFRLHSFCEQHLGYDDSRTLALLSGLSEMSSEPAVEIAKLADKIKTNGDLAKAIVDASPVAVPSLLAERDASLAAAFDQYIDRYGCRALRYELVEQTLGERPDLVASLLQDELRKPGGIASEQARLEAARAEARSNALAALPDGALRAQFETLVSEAERAYPVREDNEFFTVSAPLALLRFGALEAGERLARHDAIADAADVFFLRFDELLGGLREQGRDSKAIVAQRKQELAEAEAFDPPASYGEEPPQPPLDVLPPSWREVMSAMVYAMEKIFEPERSNRREATGARELKGIAAARGTYTGPARVIMGEHEFDRLQTGDVLVCPITSPVWSILFAKVGALVTDSGGVLSHPAIIAREYGIPAVVATGNATQIIADGQQIVVDGEAGVVRLVG